MQLIYRNEASLWLRGLAFFAGIVSLVVAAADDFAVWPVWGANQHLDLMLLLFGSAMALIGLKEVAGFVKEIYLDANGNISAHLVFRTRTLAAGSLRTLTIYAAGKDKGRLTLAAEGGSLTFPMTTFAADRLVETIKAINPLVEVVRRQ
jgi:hypothetical protein